MNYYWLALVCAVCGLASYWFNWRRSRALVASLGKEWKESVENPPIPELSIWRTYSLEELLRVNGCESLLETLRASRNVWEGECTGEWFLALRERSRASVLGVCLDAHHCRADENEEIYLNKKRQLTASAILFGHQTLSSMWLVDGDVVRAVLQYVILCEPVKVDLALEELVPVRSSEAFTVLMESSAFRAAALGVLCKTARPPNFEVFFKNLQSLSQLTGRVKSRSAVRKALTAIHLMLDRPVPLDYLCVDAQVRDYVLKINRYDPKRVKLSVVKAD